LSSNRGNNRRRGRGNNRQQGGQQINRIDSRARGNAPQLLEKYRKLAHDAHLNGDRVTEEYYLQFADHYFRVLADTRQRQEDQRPRRDDRWQDGPGSYRDDGDDTGEYGVSAGGREDRGESEPEAHAADETRGSGGSQRIAYEPQENPFLSENRSSRGPKPRRPRRDSHGGGGEGMADGEGADQQGRQHDAAIGFDPAVLPPSISANADEGEAEVAKKPAAKPRRRSTRTANPPADDAGETLQAVN
jgi:hypothetical protein